MFLLSTFDVFSTLIPKSAGENYGLDELVAFSGQGDDTLHTLLASKSAAFRQEPNVAADSQR